MEKKELITLDCLGDMCPTPLIKLKRREEELAEGKEILLVTDHSCVSESIRNYCCALRYRVRIDEPVNGVWEFYISSGKR